MYVHTYIHTYTVISLVKYHFYIRHCSYFTLHFFLLVMMMVMDDALNALPLVSQREKKKKKKKMLTWWYSMYGNKDTSRRIDKPYGTHECRSDDACTHATM